MYIMSMSYITPDTGYHANMAHLMQTNLQCHLLHTYQECFIKNMIFKFPMYIVCTAYIIHYCLTFMSHFRCILMYKNVIFPVYVIQNVHYALLPDIHVRMSRFRCIRAVPITSTSARGVTRTSARCLGERWGAGVETQKNVRGEIGGWGRVPFNKTYAPLLSTIYDGA